MKWLLPVMLLFTLQCALSQSASDVLTNYWKSETGIAGSKAVKSILKAGVPFDEVYQFLKQGRIYPSNAKTGFLNWDRRTKEGIQLFALIFIPHDYTPEKKWPVRVILHGDISHIDAYNVFRFIDTTQESFKSMEEIRIYPSGYFAARWYYRIQYENVMQLLDSVKQLYNVDENRVSLGGFSDGGTGTYAFANYDVTPYNCFLPYIGSCGALKVLGTKQVYFNNFRNKPMFIENGRLDETFPPHIVLPYVEQIQQLNAQVSFFMIDSSGHSLRWIPRLKDSIDRFISSHPRNPYSSHVVWQTENTKIFNRNHWVVINGIGKASEDGTLLKDYNEVFINGKYVPAFRRDSASGIIDVTASANTITVLTKNITSYTLLLSPDQFDFSQPFKIITNGIMSFEGMIEKNTSTLLKWNRSDNDRSMLFGAEKKIMTGKVFKPE